MQELRGDKFAVTGGAGFIGSHICEELVKQGKQVVCIDDFSSCKPGVNTVDWWDDALCTMLGKPIQLIKPEDLDGVDVVFNNAAAKSTYCVEDPFRDLSVNAWGNFQVYEAARIAGVRRVVHASTGSVYGDDYEEGIYSRTNEHGHFAPKSFYGVSKLAGEGYLRAFQEYYPSFQYAILRYYHVYGPRQDASPYGGVIPIFIRRALEGKPLVINGDGEQIRLFTWVKDVVRANFIVADEPTANGEAYNIAGAEPISVKHLAQVIKGAMRHEYLPEGSEVRIEYAPARSGDIKFFNVSCAKIGGIRGLPETGFGVGLAETIKWYVNNIGGKDDDSRRAQSDQDVQDTETQQGRSGEPGEDLSSREGFRPGDS
jgi:UDP-glucose 4-epimerase